MRPPRSGFFVSLIAAVLTVQGCKSNPEPYAQPETAAPPPVFTSAGQDGGGAILAGALLIIDLVMAPGTRSERVRRAHSIYGRCEVIIENDIPAGQKHPQPHPCTGVRLTLKKSSDGEERTTWIDGSEFQMDELTSGDYKLVAYSERFETEAHLERVRPGQALNIQIKLKRE